MRRPLTLMFALLLLSVTLARAQEVEQLTVATVAIPSHSASFIQYVFLGGGGSAYHPQKLRVALDFDPCPNCIQMQTLPNQGPTLQMGDHHGICAANGCYLNNARVSDFHSEFASRLDPNLGLMYYWHVQADLVGTFIDENGVVSPGTSVRYSFETAPESYSETLVGMTSAGVWLTVIKELN